MSKNRRHFAKGTLCSSISNQLFARHFNQLSLLQTLDYNSTKFELIFLMLDRSDMVWYKSPHATLLRISPNPILKDLTVQVRTMR